MKKSGEKMYSYVHFEKELMPGYHKEIKNSKNATEVEAVFIGTCFKLLEKVETELDKKDIEQIVFTPEKEKKWDINRLLTEKIEEKFSNSDLNAIINRFADEAFKRHEHIIKRDEDREFVNSRSGDVVNGK
ncbi:MAG TPA: hypothetical protein PK466_01185 [Thermotogota bacterium]|nr:hypothetical protein [Thermotogota bacterium]HPJ87647.1 hypothetical protein [Thermotogota bacterium]HPR94915.1 hypothetical protein [Thermotogota bacterium]